MLKFTADHEWLRLEGSDVVTVGITAHAAEQLGDVVFIELPHVGDAVEKGAEVVVIESVKAASGIAAPFAGEVVEVNEALPDEPGAVNADAMGTWFFKMRVAGAAAAMAGLMDEAAYNEMTGA